MAKIAVSACLLGRSCKYNGESNFDEPIADAVERARERGVEIVEVCPEVAGGLPTPRLPSEIVCSGARKRQGKGFGKLSSMFKKSDRDAGGSQVAGAGRGGSGWRVINAGARDVTFEFESGADECFGQCVGCDLAVLQPRSPSCGVTQIYDGSFSKRLVPGSGVFAAKLLRAGVRCVEAGDPTVVAEVERLIPVEED